MKKEQHWQDWINALLGAWVFVSPWVFQQATGTHSDMSEAAALAAWNLWVVGITLAVVAAMALLAFRSWEEWLVVGLGVWLLLSPWLLGFNVLHALRLNAVVTGALVVLFACWSLEGQSAAENEDAGAWRRSPR
jgi:hypothetical protein